MTSTTRPHRSGITLMEVLISIGILAIGLSSVVALVPAGRSEAAKAVVLDRSANLAMNVLSDAVTFGLTRPASFVTNPPLSATSPRIVVFDLLHDSLNTGTSVWENSASGTLASVRLLELVLQGRDDLAYNAPAGDDSPPTNLFTSGTGSRQFLGRTTALVSLAATGTMTSGTLTPGEVAKVTAVVFHNRSVGSLSDAIVTGTYNDASQPSGTILAPQSNLPSDRSLKDVIRPGSVIYAGSAAPGSRWYQVAMASVDDSAGIVYVTFVGDLEPPAGPIQIAIDSVGLAERVVTLEGPGPYVQ